MIITVTNPINNEQVEIEAFVTTNISISPEGVTTLMVSAVGSTEVANAYS